GGTGRGHRLRSGPIRRATAPRGHRGPLGRHPVAVRLPDPRGTVGTTAVAQTRRAAFAENTSGHRLVAAEHRYPSSEATAVALRCPFRSRVGGVAATVACPPRARDGGPRGQPAMGRALSAVGGGQPEAQTQGRGHDPLPGPSLRPHPPVVDRTWLS